VRGLIRRLGKSAATVTAGMCDVLVHNRAGICLAMPDSLFQPCRWSLPDVGMCFALGGMTSALERVTGWLEGCRCHEHLLLPGAGRPQGYRARLNQFRKASAKCCWAGRRAVELVATKSDIILARIRAAASNRFSEYLASEACTLEIRRDSIGFFEQVKQSVASILLSKLSYLNEVPYKFLGVIAHLVGGQSIDFARECCRQCLAERDRIISECPHKLHRVAVFLSVGHANQCRVDLEVFAAGGKLGAHAVTELRKYAMASLALRETKTLQPILCSLLGYTLGTVESGARVFPGGRGIPGHTQGPGHSRETGVYSGIPREPVLYTRGPGTCGSRVRVAGKHGAPIYPEVKPTRGSVIRGATGVNREPGFTRGPVLPSARAYSRSYIFCFCLRCSLIARGC
jgi:hypothetical protein